MSFVLYEFRSKATSAGGLAAIYQVEEVTGYQQHCLGRWMMGKRLWDLILQQAPAVLQF